MPTPNEIESALEWFELHEKHDPNGRILASAYRNAIASEREAAKGARELAIRVIKAAHQNISTDDIDMTEAVTLVKSTFQARLASAREQEDLSRECMYSECPRREGQNEYVVSCDGSMCETMRANSEQKRAELAERKGEEMRVALVEWESFREAFEGLAYHSEGMGCGIEDRGITDRYQACEYGWDMAMDRVAEQMPGYTVKE
jgi:hypothetical protein